MNHISLKKETIISYMCMPSVEALKGNLVQVVTAAGVITGTPVNSDSETDNVIKVIESLNSQIIERHKKDVNIPSDDPTSGNDGFFTLKDVTLFSGNNQGKFKILNIFFDQVIAITIGNSSDANQ